MDHQAFVDTVFVPCAVLSVERTPEGHCGEVRIVRSNQAYKDAMGPAYYDNMIYSELVPKDAKFEDFCFRAAILKQRMHAYVEVRAMNGWIDQLIIPLESESESLGYCQFMFEFTQSADASRMANVSVDTAKAVIQACITLLGAENFKESVRTVLQDIVDLSGAIGSRIMLIDHKRREAASFCECFPHGFESTSGAATLSYEVVDSWEDMIGESNAVIIKDEQDMTRLEKRNPAWVASMRSFGVTSIVLIPLRRGKEVIGYLYVTNFDVSKVVEVKELLELTSFFLGSEISNYLLMARLEEMGTIDELTGIHNRNALMQNTALLEEEGFPPYGLISVDLNGLKMANDTEGHKAGDELLKRAAGVLRKVFRKDDLYRVGGDEFIVLATNISQELFEAKVGQLREIIDASDDVSAAIGSFWSDGSVDIQTAGRHADELMYADKKLFYTQHPEFERR